MFKRLLTAFSVMLLAILAVACSTSAKSGSNQKIQVVATAIDPHDYEPTTKVGKQVATANLIVASGIGYDGWMDKLVKSESKSKQYLRVADDLMGKHEGDNEHIWYDPRTMPKLANALADKFAKQDPSKGHLQSQRQEVHRLTR